MKSKEIKDYKGKMFQFVKGDFIGKYIVCKDVVSKNGKIWLEFEDDDIKYYDTDMIGTDLIEVSGTDGGYEIITEQIKDLKKITENGETFYVPGAMHGMIRKKLGRKKSEIKQQTPKTEKHFVPLKQKEQPKNSALYELIKNAKKDKVVLNVDIEIEIIKKSLYEILKDSFNEKELNETIVKYIKEKISNDMIDRYINRAIEKYFLSIGKDKQKE